jgi:hypothetical protein
MKMEEWLRTLASIASILTATIAAGASLFYSASKRAKRLRLEKYLKIEKSKSPNEFRSTTRIMAELGMTEAEILAASFSSRHVKRGVRVDIETGFAAEVLFQYCETPPNSN